MAVAGGRRHSLTITPPEELPVPLDAVDSSLTPRRFVLRVVLAARRYTVPGAALLVCWQLAESMVPVIVGVALDRAVGAGNPGQLLLWLLVLAVNMTVLSVSFRFGSRIGLTGMQAVQHRLRTLVAARLLDRRGMSGPARLPGVGLSIATSDVSRLATAVALACYPLAELAAVLVGGAILLALSWPLGVAVLVGTPVLVLVIDRAGRSLRARSGAEQAAAATAAGQAADLMAGYRVVMGLAAGQQAGDRYRYASRTALQATLHAKSAHGRLLGSMQAATGVFLAVITLAAGWLALTGRLSIGGLITVVGLSQFLIGPLTMVATNSGAVWAAATASAERVLRVLNDPGVRDQAGGTNRDQASGTTRDQAGGTTRGQASGPAQHGQADRLDDPGPLALDVPLDGQHLRGQVHPGECVAIPVDGARATTLATLLSGAGGTDTAVTCRGVPLGQLPPGTVLVAPREAHLFDGTVLENVQLGAVTEHRAEEALADAGCTEFLRALPEGVSTQVGEGGRQLSGGQRQRVALARALAQDAPVLVLHDPTTAVDSVTERVVAERIRASRAGTITVLLTRSPALLAVADRVLEPAAGMPEGLSAVTR